VNNCNDIRTVIAITIFDTRVSPPALKFTAVRENEPVYKVWALVKHQRSIQLIKEKDTLSLLMEVGNVRIERENRKWNAPKVCYKIVFLNKLFAPTNFYDLVYTMLQQILLQIQYWSPKILYSAKRNQRISIVAR